MLNMDRTSGDFCPGQAEGESLGFLVEFAWRWPHRERGKAMAKSLQEYLGEGFTHLVMKPRGRGPLHWRQEVAPKTGGELRANRDACGLARKRQGDPGPAPEPGFPPGLVRCCKWSRNRDTSLSNA